MELDNIRFAQIHRYLSGQMEAAELQAFTAQLAADADLKTEVDIQRQIKAAYQINHIKTELNDVRAKLLASNQLWQPPVVIPPIVELERKKKERRIGMIAPAYYAMAACFVLAVGLGWYFFFNQNEPQSGGQLAKHAPKSKTPINPIDSARQPAPSLPEPTPIQEPQLANRYDKVFDQNFSPTLRRTPPVSPDNQRFTAPRVNLEPVQRISQDTTDILTGIKLLKRGKTQLAIAKLSSATNCALPDWQANARWFLALAYIKNNQPNKARSPLQALTNDKTKLYQTDAQKLLKTLSLKN